MNLFRRKSGILGNFKGIGVVITAIAISLGVGAIVLDEFQTQAYDEVTVTNETHATNLSDTGYKVIEVNNYAQGLPEDDTGPVKVYDPYGSEPVEYSVVEWTASTGKINVTSYYDSSTDTHDVALDYDHLETNKATSILGEGLNLLQDTIDWMGVAVIMLFGVIFMRYME